MIGGTVIEVVDLATKVYINVAERPYNKIETCAIYVERNESSEKIEIGDQIWWQSNFAMWTPAKNRNPNLKELKCGVDYDIQIQRVGFSGVNPPYNLKGK